MLPTNAMSIGYEYVWKSIIKFPKIHKFHYNMSNLSIIFY